MYTLTHFMAPNAADMVRADHTRVIALFHRYRTADDWARKQALVDTVCSGLEVHAQLEEEIFYPALRAAAVDAGVLEKSVPEHDEMKRLIGRLRELHPSDPAYDECFMELIRDVMRHAADEETILLPAAEKALGGRMRELGVEMMKRRVELKAPMIPDIARNAARMNPMFYGMLGVGMLAATALWLGRGGARSVRLLPERG